jgi:hypothetical protein
MVERRSQDSEDRRSAVFLRAAWASSNIGPCRMTVKTRLQQASRKLATGQLDAILMPSCQRSNTRLILRVMVAHVALCSLVQHGAPTVCTVQTTTMASHGQYSYLTRYWCCAGSVAVDMAFTRRDGRGGCHQGRARHELPCAVQGPLMYIFGGSWVHFPISGFMPDAASCSARPAQVVTAVSSSAASAAWRPFVCG